MDAAQETWPGLRAPEPTTRGEEVRNGAGKGGLAAGSRKCATSTACSATIWLQSETQTTDALQHRDDGRRQQRQPNSTAHPRIPANPILQIRCRQLTGVLISQNMKHARRARGKVGQHHPNPRQTRHTHTHGKGNGHSTESSLFLLEAFPLLSLARRRGASASASASAAAAAWPP